MRKTNLISEESIILNSIIYCNRRNASCLFFLLNEIINVAELTSFNTAHKYNSSQWMKDNLDLKTERTNSSLLLLPSVAMISPSLQVLKVTFSKRETGSP